MLTMGQLAKWVVDTLSSDGTFTSLCVSQVGSALNFYRHTPVDGRVIEQSPFLTAYSSELGRDFSGQSEYRNTWEIPLAIGYEVPLAEESSSTDGLATVWLPTDKVELIAANAVEILRKQASSCGIYGESVIILNARVIVTEIGEAVDVQANVFITFGEMINI